MIASLVEVAVTARGNDNPQNRSRSQRESGGNDAFARALKEAISGSGLALSRIRHRLQLHGVQVSAATLSYWQSGRSRPERPESLIALAHLEDVLGLAPHALRGLLGPPRPRGQHIDRDSIAMPTEALWAQRDQVGAVMRQVDNRWDAELDRLSQHDRLTVGADRCEQSFWTRQVLRALRDGPDRWVHLYRIDEPGLPLPDACPLRGGRLGRLVRDEAAGLLAAEVLFDRPLSRGETVIVEYELRYRDPRPIATNFESKFPLPVRHYALEVDFTAPALPARCSLVIAPDADSGETTRRPVVLDAAHRAHAVALDIDPCCYGMRWTW